MPKKQGYKGKRQATPRPRRRSTNRATSRALDFLDRDMGSGRDKRKGKGKGK